MHGRPLRKNRRRVFSLTANRANRPVRWKGTHADLAFTKAGRILSCELSPPAAPASFLMYSPLCLLKLRRVCVERSRQINSITHTEGGTTEWSVVVAVVLLACYLFSFMVGLHFPVE